MAKIIAGARECGTSLLPWRTMTLVALLLSLPVIASAQDDQLVEPAPVEEPTIIIIVDRQSEQSPEILLAARGLLGDLSVNLDVCWVDELTRDLVRTRALAERVVSEQSALGAFWFRLGVRAEVFFYLPEAPRGRTFRRSFAEDEEVFAETFALVVRATTIVLLHEDRGQAQLALVRSNEWDDTSEVESPSDDEPAPEEPEEPDLATSAAVDEERALWDIGFGLKVVASFHGVSLCGGPYVTLDWAHRTGFLLGVEVFGTVFGGDVAYGGAYADVLMVGSRLQLGYSWSPHWLFTLRPAAGVGIIAVRARGVPQAPLIHRTEWSLGPLLHITTVIALRLAPHIRFTSSITVSFAVPGFIIAFEETIAAELGPVLLEGVVGVEIFW